MKKNRHGGIESTSVQANDLKYKNYQQWKQEGQHYIYKTTTVYHMTPSMIVVRVWLLCIL